MKVPELPHTTLGGLQPFPTIRARLLYLTEDTTHGVCRQVLASRVRHPVYGKLRVASLGEISWLLREYLQEFFR